MDEHMKTNTTEEGIEKAFTNGTSYLWAPRRREKPCMMECHDKSGVPVTVFTVGTQTSEVTVRGVRMWEKQGENASGRVSGVGCACGCACVSCGADDCDPMVCSCYPDSRCRSFIVGNGHVFHCCCPSCAMYIARPSPRAPSSVPCLACRGWWRLWGPFNRS